MCFTKNNNNNNSNNENLFNLTKPTIYITGYEDTDDYRIACYWVNGLKCSLSDGSSYATANAISLVNNDVYIVGQDGKEACYWINGLKYSLTDGNRNAAAYDIFINENDIYLVGNIIVGLI